LWAAVAATALALIGVTAWRLAERRAQASTQAKQAAAREISVTVATVERQDVPQWLEGLGNVLALSTVTVRSRVDGQLDEVPFTEGQYVNKGDPLAQIDPRPFRIAVAQAEATLRRDEAVLRNNQKNLDRYRGLWKQRLIPQQQVTDQHAAVDQAAGMVGIDRTLVDNAHLQLEWSTVTAPADGIVGIRQVDPGNLVHPTDPAGLVVLTRLDPIGVVFTLPQDFLSRIAEAQARGPVAVEAWPREGDTPLGEGRLTLLDNQVNPGTATLRLKAVVQNPQHKLWPSQYVKARLKVAMREGATVVPSEAVQRGARGPYVYVIKEGVAEARDVEVDSFEGPLALVHQGLELGEQVVIDGQSQLRPGAKVKAQPRKPSPAPPPRVGT
jgi:multidrug efflux system membrane fusion protein